MQLFDMFIVETPADARVCALTGVFDIALDRLECENCSMAVGVVADNFIPVAIITELSSNSVWPVCVDCATPIVFPGDWRER